MARFFLPPSNINGHSFTLSGSEAHHALHVLRKKIGDEIDLFDGLDASYRGRIENIAGQEIRGTLLKNPKQTPLPVAIVLYQALVKGAKWEWLLEKSGEIGVTRVVPVFTQRSLIKLDAARGAQKTERWRRIALAACKQSGRSDLMAVDLPCDFSAALSGLEPEQLSLIPWEKEGERTIHDACEKFQGGRANIFIGPEGGWDSSEIEAAKRSQVVPVRLGPTLLRTETAGLVAATLMLREFGVY